MLVISSPDAASKRFSNPMLLGLFRAGIEWDLLKVHPSVRILRDAIAEDGLAFAPK